MYKLNTAYDGTVCVRKDCGNGVIWLIPQDPDNTDYATFKRHIQGLDENGNSITPAELQDADGNTMSPEEVAEFLATLP